MVPIDGHVNIPHQVVEIESKDQLDFNHVQVEHHGITRDNEVNDLDHEEVQQENIHTLQKQKQEFLDTTRSKRNYKLV